jgi:glucose/arabinose dehydrogenase/mono/diheme cytochrome c family protein
MRFISLLLLASITPSWSQRETPPEDPNALKRLGEPATKSVSRGPFPNGQFQLESQETIAILGGDHLAQAATDGRLEAGLLKRFASEAPKLRWLAVPGDTVYAQNREMNFGAWEGQLKWSGATIVACQFGRMESFEGAEKIPAFIAAYHKLLDQFQSVTQRILLIEPAPFLPFQTIGRIGSRVPDLSGRNEVLQLYTAAIRQIARDRKAVFLENNDLSEFIEAGAGEPLLLEAIQEKNRLWNQCWRPPNWAFAYGDRAWAEFGKPGGGAPFLKDEFAQFKPVIAQLDTRIAALASNQTAPPAPPKAAPRQESIPALTPAEQLATFQLAAGYEVNLFADETMGVVKPTQISWDEQGRLYVACSPSYPHLAPGESPSDYVLVCEDTNRDGKADLTWKFAENLTMTQGMEPGDGGLYICDFDQLVHYATPHGKQPSTKRRVLLSGFGTGDTHQLINSICHGEDGKLWFSQGLHIYSRIETPHGLVSLEKSGIWRFDPTTFKLEGFFHGAKAGHNCWGVAFDDAGQIFHKSGDRPEGYWSVPGLSPVADPEEYHTIGGLFKTNPKTTALEFIGSSALPAELQGGALIAGFMGSLVEVHKISDQGSGYQTTQLPRLLTSTNNAFRPVDVSVGPDGAIYVCDFYNPIIGHYQASYRDPKRDKSHGRIWRITAKNRPLITPPNFAKASPGELVEILKSPERWNRQQARRLLAELPATVVLPIIEPLTVASAPSGNFPRELLNIALAHQQVSSKFREALLNSSDATLRAAATRSIGTLPGTTQENARWLEPLLLDENPRVRVEALIAASYAPLDQSAKLMLRVLDRPLDPVLEYTLRQTLRSLKIQPSDGLSESAQAYLKKIKATPVVATSPGQVIYETVCMNCHQSNGQGLPGFYPPVAKSDWVHGDAERLVKILLHGLSGPIQVNGADFTQSTPIPMPASGLTDQQIADVTTYLRTAFGNQAPAITKDAVEKIRSAFPNKDTPWTQAE